MSEMIKSAEGKFVSAVDHDLQARSDEPLNENQKNLESREVQTSVKECLCRLIQDLPLRLISPPFLPASTALWGLLRKLPHLICPMNYLRASEAVRVGVFRL